MVHETVMARSQSSFDELKMLLQANMGVQQHHRPAKKARTVTREKWREWSLSLD